MNTVLSKTVAPAAVGDGPEPPASAMPSEQRRRIAEIRQALANGRYDAALALAERLLAIQFGPRILERVFSQARRPDLLVELMWRRRDVALRHLSNVADYMRMCAPAPQREHRLSELNSWLLSAATPPVRFSHRDYLNQFKLDDGAKRDLFRIKYKGWDDPASGTLSQRVEALAARCETPAELLDAVRGSVANPPPPDPEWTSEIAVAQSFGHVFRDVNIAGQLLSRRVEGDNTFLHAFRSSVVDGLPTLVDMEYWEAFFRDIDVSRGLLACTFHNQFAKIAISLFNRFKPAAYTVHVDELSGHGDSPLRNGRRGAAFRALKTLMDKKAVLIAPDGPNFSDAAAVAFQVRGLTVKISAGAALIAYEARSDTGWYHAARKHGRFVPVYTPGPARSPGESFAQFKDRWISFYAAQYEAALTSSPADLIFFLRNSMR